jgi:hypothetical protein
MNRATQGIKDRTGFRLALSVMFVIALYYGAHADDKIGQPSAADVIRRFHEVTGLKGKARQPYHLSGRFQSSEGKINGALDVDQRDADHQWLKVEIPQHGKHLRARDGERMWHFDPSPDSRAGDGWFIYPRPGYSYSTNESQTRFHELFDIYDAIDEQRFGQQLAKVNLDGKDCYQLTHIRSGNRRSEECFDPASGLRAAVKYSDPNPTTFLFADYKDFGGIKIPTRITEVVGSKTKDVLITTNLIFTSVGASKFAMPLCVQDWPAGWSEFDEAYPPPSFVKDAWPWKGEHSRYFHEDFGQADRPNFWSYVVFNALEGDTLKTADEVKDALHRYDAALYGKSFAPENIKVSVASEKTETKLGHTVTRRSVQIDGFDAEATRKPLTTHLQVFRWYCPITDRTGMMILRSPREFSESDEVWKALLSFWQEAECHPAP